MKYILVLLCSLAFFRVSSQDEPIFLENPSFEGIPAEGSRNGQMVDGWYDCGFPGETIPDVHPKENSVFGVDTKASHGNTYIGMVVRDNETWERISQRLTKPLEAGKCYEFSISTARSLTYVSRSQTNGQVVNFATPAKLRIWGGNGLCDRNELLAESALIINNNWKVSIFRFEPKKVANYIVFEVFYKTPSPFPYNGNILLDNAQPIIPVPCEIEEPEVLPEEEPVVEEGESPTPSSPPVADISTEPSTVTPAKKPKILPDLERGKLRKGQTIRIDQLYFKSDSFAITEPSYPVLDEIYDFLSDNQDVIVEIGGHTNNIPTHEYCDRLSNQRAKAVADYLSKKGIPRTRLQFKGYGKRHPIESNSTIYGRRKNQRVEIKILGFDG